MENNSVSVNTHLSNRKENENEICQPKIVIIRRRENQGFGFTLRHFIAYPPEEWTFSRTSSQPQAMETVFIKEVHLNGPAHLAGLQTGDRLLMVNNMPISGVPYSTIVSIIKKTPSILRLQIVAKECDVLQMYYTDIAHNPETNRQRTIVSHTIPSNSPSPTARNQKCERPPINDVHLADPRGNILQSLRNDEVMHLNSADLTLSPTMTQIDFMSRLRKSIEQKEEFLKSPPFYMPTHFIQQKEFYSRPNRMLHTAWPPALEENASSISESTLLNTPLLEAPPEKQQTCVKSSTIENQENVFSNDNQKKPIDGKLVNYARDHFNGYLRTQQISPEMKINEKINEIKQSDGFKVVSELTKQFECGRPLSPDNEFVDKTSLYKSELSRIKTNLVVPVVTMRKKEIERKIGANVNEKSDLINRRQAFNDDASGVIDYSKHAQLFAQEPNITEKSSNKAENCDQYQLSTTNPQIVRRYKSIVLDDTRPMRRISYLRATGNEAEFNAENVNAGQLTVSENHDIETDQTTSNVKIVHSNTMLKGDFNLKPIYVRGKRSSFRAWRPIKVKLYGNILRGDIGRDMKNEGNIGNLLTEMDIRSFNVTEDEYTKRKYVFKLTSKPQRKDSDTLTETVKNSEGTQLLFQTTSAEELKQWMTALCAASYGEDLVHDTVVSHVKQSAEPQQIAASKSVQTNIYCEETINPYSSSGSSTAKSIGENDNNFGTSPMLKSRKSSHQNKESSDKEMGSPKTKNWKDLLFRRIQGHSSDIPSSHLSHINPVGSIGVPLKQCKMSKENQFVPYLVELCTKIVESKGLTVIGIYRIPGNKAAISELKEQVNKQDFVYEEIVGDSKWDDVNVVSSLLKLFIRSLPDAILPSSFYNNFIEADKKVGEHRLKELKSLLEALPIYSYETLKHIIRHLHRVSLNCSVNLMEPKNLAIIFGPSIVRTPNETLEIAVKDMKNQCRIVELLVSQYEYFFTNGPMPYLPESLGTSSIISHNDQTSLLLDNVSKIESLHHEKESVGSRFIPHLRRRTHTKRSASTSINSDTYSGESILSFESKKTVEYRTTGSCEFRDKSVQDSVDAASVLTDDESNISRISDAGSMSLTTITDALDSKLRNLRNIPNAVEYSDEKPLQHIDNFPKPLTMGGNIPYADESPERVLNLNKLTHGNRITYVTQDWSHHNRDTIRNISTNTRLSYLHETYSDDSEVSTTSDPKESFIISPLLMERYRKRRGHRLYRSASFNCRNYTSRAAHNHSHLTKDEKTDMNITKKRQIQNKQNRSIKRRHTVGGPHDYPITLARRSNNSHGAVLEVNKKSQRSEK